MPLLRACSSPGCTTLTLGAFCVEHEDARGRNESADGVRLSPCPPSGSRRRDAPAVAALVAERVGGLDRAARIEAVREIARTGDPAALVMAWCLFYAGEPLGDLACAEFERESTRLWAAAGGRQQEFLARDAAYELFRAWKRRQRRAG